MPEIIYLDGLTLTPEDLFKVRDPNYHIALTEDAWKRVEKSRAVIDRIVEEKRTVYGINTGFGANAQVIIPPDELAALQRNLIVSHAAGVGEPIPVEQARMMMALRVNVLAKGCSGARVETIKTYIECHNKYLIPLIPSKGTVGASGDLAPLAHAALGVIGEGLMWDPELSDYKPSADVLKKYGIEPVELAPKEGLALINGTQFISSIGTTALIRAKNAALTADIAAAMSIEALRGTPDALEHRIHAVRPHTGQIDVAKRMRRILTNKPSATECIREADEAGKVVSRSEMWLDHGYKGKVQDAYSLRCIPQVHGISHDTVSWVDSLMRIELNSATDNPMIFFVEGGEKGEGDSRSGGNFHAEYPAKALDYLAIGIHELASISERRVDRMCNPPSNGGELPAFLVKEKGLCSGYMIAQYTAASLVSEDKVLCHPASVDSITVSANQEDHDSMGGF
ncbi:Histidine ammonia-lyase, partial [Aduncisulcus paluster]